MSTKFSDILSYTAKHWQLIAFIITAYSFTCGILFLWGYWGFFDIPFYNFVSFQDVFFVALIPLLISLFAFIMGILIAYFDLPSIGKKKVTPSTADDHSPYPVTTLIKYCAILVLLTTTAVLNYVLIFLLLYFFSLPFIKSIRLSHYTIYNFIFQLLAFLTTFFFIAGHFKYVLILFMVMLSASIFLIHGSDITFTNSHLTLILSFSISFLPTSFLAGRANALDFRDNINFKYIEAKLYPDLNSIFTTAAPKYIGSLRDYYFFQSQPEQVIMIKQNSLPALVLYKHKFGEDNSPLHKPTSP